MTTIIAELSTNHGGDVSLAEDMIRAAADAGCDYAKIQTYSLARLNPADPQREWLTTAHLDNAAHERLIKVAEDAGVAFLSTPFDADSLAMLRELGLKTFKIASSESGNGWWYPNSGEYWFVSWPWGIGAPVMVESALGPAHGHIALTAIPLYPTPLEAVGRAKLLDGWSDHTVGLAACQWAIAHGAQVIEAHLKLPGRGRECAWDKEPRQFRELRDFADAVSTMTTGVSTTFRRRWSA